MAYQGLGQYDDSLVSFSEGLAIDPKLSSALVGLIDSMLKSPYKGKRKFSAVWYLMNLVIVYVSAIIV